MEKISHANSNPKENWSDHTGIQQNRLQDKKLLLKTKKNSIQLL